MRRRSKGRRGADVGQSRTVTERDVRHLERHLSMKKTIRKKIMRDLRQAFVDDPARIGDAGAADGGGDEDLVGAINFGGGERQVLLLDMLRGDVGSDDSGIGGEEGGIDSRKSRGIGEASAPGPQAGSNNARHGRRLEVEDVIGQDADALDTSGSESEEERVQQKSKRSFWKRLLGKTKD